MSRPLVRLLVLGAILGALILGVGGRLAMAVIQANAGATPRFTLGGTMTVIALGAVSGVAGAVMALISRIAAGRLSPRFRWIQYALFAVLLVLVTMRGLRGTPGSGHWYFYALVAAYGVALALAAGRNRAMLRSQSQRPGRFASE